MKYDKVRTESLALEARIRAEKEERERLEEERNKLVSSKRDAERVHRSLSRTGRRWSSSWASRGTPWSRPR